MTILLTGGAGFIGTHVLAALLRNGHEVRVLDSLRADVHRSGDWRPPAGVAFFRGDVRNPALVMEALEGVDAVVHLAAKVGLGVSLDDMPDYAGTNDTGTAILLAAMARRNVPRLVLASSMVVYGEGQADCAEHGAVTPAPRRPEDLAAGRFEPRCPHCARPLAHRLVDEATPFDPRNAYATSKMAQELYAANWARMTQGSVAALRYHNVYGPGMPQDTPYAGVASLFASALLKGEAPRVFEDGGQRRDFVHVRDVASATVAALERHEAGVAAFNVGSGTPRTVGEMADALATALAGPRPVITGGFRLGDVRHITADSRRLREDLGWRPQEDFAAGIAAFAAEARARAAPTRRAS
ncbi:NAD-dependent epimerase/dehydratase family protein [Aquabacter sp. L1I39]|uniref:NAD-dependent epimerase/dehydratase family protein n=1 Tax=Aquabacter sp. L1I39 TaxID=2820278 RepID=UPI001ADA1C65|nr:NAD-dependent epimerase/dehydratase family protein [Aquabacter sp. L1I39]QTL02022.1 NAD-dependent epimerase/dehydratase family protein [Aquabacter sp. L1I39]